MSNDWEKDKRRRRFKNKKKNKKGNYSQKTGTARQHEEEMLRDLDEMYQEWEDEAEEAEAELEAEWKAIMNGDY